MKYLRIIKDVANAIVVNDNELKILTEDNHISVCFKGYSINVYFCDGQWANFDVWIVSGKEDIPDGWIVDFDNAVIENDLFSLYITKTN